MFWEPFAPTEGNDLDRQLGRLCFSIIIDNLTASWLYVPDAARFVPPYTYGVIFAVTSGTQSAKIQWRTPTGYPVPTPGTNAAQVVFTDQTLTPSSGFNVAPINLAPQNVTITPQPVRVTQDPWPWKPESVSPEPVDSYTNAHASAAGVGALTFGGSFASSQTQFTGSVWITIQSPATGIVAIKNPKYTSADKTILQLDGPGSISIPIVTPYDPTVNAWDISVANAPVFDCGAVGIVN